MLHKTFSKVLVNCFKPILAKVIGESQSAFVRNRLIIDNILIASKVFHWLLKIQGEQEAFAIKIDISKAYDRVEWVFFFFAMDAQQDLFSRALNRVDNVICVDYPVLNFDHWGIINFFCPFSGTSTR